ncbi:MAG: hypothetical protein V7607_3234 [Solirubrobacteraceae bacterium]
MAAPKAGRDARAMDDHDAIARLRASMDRLGQPVDDLPDAELRRRAPALVGDRPDAVDRIVRTLGEPDPDDEPECARSDGSH